MKIKVIFSILTLIVLSVYCQQNPREGNEMNANKQDSYAEKRRQMVENQIISRGVRDQRVIQAMMKVKRHRFVPKNLQSAAYYDEPLPIGNEQTISQPYIVAYMTEALKMKGGEKVLEIGTGSGYQAAVLAEIAAEVYSIEIVRPLGERAEQLLKSEGYSNIQCRIGDGYKGWPEVAPFDAIIVTAAPPRIPEPLVEQLKEGGRMIVPVGKWFQDLILISKKKGKVEKKRLIPVRFVPITGEIQKEKKD